MIKVKTHGSSQQKITEIWPSELQKQCAHILAGTPIMYYSYSCGAGAYVFQSRCQGLYPYQSEQRKPQARGDYIVARPPNTSMTQLHQSSGVGRWWLFSSGLMGTVDILQASSAKPRYQPTFPVADHDTLLKLSFISDYSKTCPQRAYMSDSRM